MPSAAHALLTGLAALAAAPATQAGTILDRYVGTNAHARISDDQVFAATGAFTSASGFVFASGTLLDDGWVVTAAHVVDDASSLRFRINGVTHESTTWVQTTTWNGDVSDGGDLAMVRLGGPVSGATSASLAESAVENGDSVLLAGYGSTGSGSTGYDPFSGGELIGGTNLVDRIDGDILLTDFDDEGVGGRPNSLGGSRNTRYELSSAPGDSGGGLYTRDEQGWNLAGVTSFIAAFDGSLDAGYGDLSGYTALDPYADWISAVRATTSDEELLALDDSGSTSSSGSGFDVRVVPEPEAALPLAALLLLARRRQALASA